MARIWTVRLKRSVNSDLVEGFTVQVRTEQDCHDYSKLSTILGEMGVSRNCDYFSDYYWDWM
ncbi:MAG: hypothetical protein LKE41_07815 [Prevotella sp.]|nr:hypothetical protein [Prevotella sp.]MCI2080490.1 hypothetical protein [Prevotella sp.]MCI2102314.1 hypothetical protein [Prevotella sp.]